MTQTEIRVRHARDRWGFWRAMDLYDRGARDVRLAGYGDPVFDESLRFLWVEDETEIPIGFLAYSYDWLDEELWIELAYVNPDHRRQGVYAAMYKRLVEIGRRLKAATIACGIHEQNQVMLAVALATGCKLRRPRCDPFFSARFFLRPDRFDEEDV